MDTTILKNYDVKNITFKKPEKISDKITIFNIKYNKTSNFVIQTPKFLVPNIPTIYCHKTMKFYKLRIVAHDYAFEKKTKDFVNKIKEIESYIKEKSPNLWKKCGYSDKNKKFVNSVLYNKEKTKVNFYFNLQLYDNKPILSVYDWKKNKQDFDYLIPNSHAYSLIWLENIWIKSRKIGLNWVILQMKVYLPIYKITECLIEDEYDNDSDVEDIKSEKSINNGIKLKDHPIYKRFFNMKRFGVPVQSIQSKMNIENYDTQIILKDYRIFTPRTIGLILFILN